ncbi:hypothetical protein BC827DRAFT_35690 [Russula dissimulans]|nr:hypothetical protein BC827DRAFT_35690 [Russula dissimulans]
MYARVQRRTVHPIHSERKRDSSTQLPDPQRALERIARLVKPGGWLLLEEVSITGEVEGDAPAVRATYGLLVKYWETSGGDARFSEKLESTLRESSAFSEVNVHEVVAPVGSLAGPADPPKCGPLGLMFAKSFRRTFSVEETHPKMLALGLTPELMQIVEELNTLEWPATALYLGVKVNLILRTLLVFVGEKTNTHEVEEYGIM